MDLGTGDHIAEMAIIAVDLTKTYLLGKVSVEALRGLSLAVRSGELAAIVGPSGCGKSTLLNIIGSLDRPSAGILIIDGVNVSQISRRQIMEMRRRSGFVFQSYNLVPRLTAQENVELGTAICGVSRSIRRKRARELLEYVGLGDRLNHRPSELSGGQQQRVAIARALANRPRLLLMDEPTGNLDSKTAQDMFSLIRHLSREEHLTTLIVTHDPRIADLADRTFHMIDGVIVKETVNG